MGEARGLEMGAGARREGTRVENSLLNQPRVLRNKESHKIRVFMGHYKFKHQAHQVKPSNQSSKGKDEDRDLKPRADSLA